MTCNVDVMADFSFIKKGKSTLTDLQFNDNHKKAIALFEFLVYNMSHIITNKFDCCKQFSEEI